MFCELGVLIALAVAHKVEQQLSESRLSSKQAHQGTPLVPNMAPSCATLTCCWLCLSLALCAVAG